MVFCSTCNTYYKKLSMGDMCKQCCNELSGTPPGMNCMMKQYESFVKRKAEDVRILHVYRSNATLLDIVADELICQTDKIVVLASYLPEGNLPWYSLLRAWYRKNKKRCRSIAKEQYPKERVLRLLGIDEEC